MHKEFEEYLNKAIQSEGFESLFTELELTPEVILFLLYQQRHKDEVIRHRAKWVLLYQVDFSSETHVPMAELLASLDDENEYVRIAGASLLAKFQAAAAIPILLQALEHEEEEIKFQAVVSLQRFDIVSLIKPDMAKRLLAILVSSLQERMAFSYSKEAFKILISLPESKAYVAGLLENVTSESRRNWIGYLMNSTTNILLPPYLIKTMEEVEPAEFSRIMAALVRSKTLDVEESISILIEEITSKESSYYLRYASIRSLIFLGGRRAAPVILPLLLDADYGIRNQIIRFIKCMGISDEAVTAVLKEVMPIWIKQFRLENGCIHRSLILQIGEFGILAASVVPDLLNLLHNEDKHTVRDTIVTTLEKIGTPAALAVVEKEKASRQFRPERSVLGSLYFPKANLSHANFEKMELWGDNFEGANLAYANVSHAQLNEANFASADLSHANLSNAKADSNFKGANLMFAILTHADLEGASYDSETRFPEHFDPKAAGMIFIEKPASE